MKAYLGIDIGTSGAKALALGVDGRVLGRGVSELTVCTPAANMAEQDPATWLVSVRESVRQITSSLSPDVQIAGIGLSGQMLGSVFLDAALRPLMPCILWLDSRADAQCRTLLERFGNDFWLERTANMPLSSYWVSKLLWLRENRPDVYDKTRHVIFPKDYVRLYLTKELGTDVTDASATCLFDTARRSWDRSLFDLLGLDYSHVSSHVMEAGDIAGCLCADAAAELGLPAGIPVIAGGGDQSMGGIGNGVVQDGMISVSIGTSGVVFTSSAKPIIDRKQRAGLCYCHAVRDTWCFFGCTNTAGGSFQWLRNNLGPQADTANPGAYTRMTEAAAQAAPGSNGLFFLPYLNGERTPYADANATGVFFGLTLRHRWNEMVRAVMEGVTYSLRDSIEILREHGVSPQYVYASGGGARSRLWMQIQADVFNTVVVRNQIDEGPACGAAIAAMVASGEYGAVSEACVHLLKPEITVEPSAEQVKRYEACYEFYKSLYPVMKDSFARRAALPLY